MPSNNASSSMHPEAQTDTDSKKIHKCTIGNCRAAFECKAHLIRHQESTKHKKNPTWFYCHWRLKSGGLCEHRVQNQANNLLEHIEVAHLNCIFHCCWCDATIARYTSIGVHFNNCKAIQRQVAAGDKRHYCKFFREERRPDRADLPAIEPEGWVYKTHIERIEKKEASEERSRVLGRSRARAGRGTMEKRRARKMATTTTSEPVAGPSRSQASPAPVGSTSVPSTTHFNEVNVSIIQSHQTHRASSSNTTDPFLAGPTHSGLQLPIPANPSIPFSYLFANGYQQPSFPAFPLQPPTTVRRRQYIRHRHHPYRREDTSDNLPSSHHNLPMPEFEQGSSTGRSRSSTSSVPSPPSPWPARPTYRAYRARENFDYAYRARTNPARTLPNVDSLCPDEPQPEDDDGDFDEEGRPRYPRLYLPPHMYRRTPPPEEVLMASLPRLSDAEREILHAPVTTFDSDIQSTGNGLSLPYSGVSGDDAWDFYMQPNGITATSSGHDEYLPPPFLREDSDNSQGFELGGRGTIDG